MKTPADQNENFARERTIEITAWLLGMLIVAFLLISSTAKAITPNFEEEAYIDDIPFNTEMIVNDLLLTELKFEAELYINDIPFSTEEMAHEILESGLLGFNFEEEVYIDDIPFSTKNIATDYAYRLAIIQPFVMPEEAYVDDIPFNTYTVVYLARTEFVANENTK